MLSKSINFLEDQCCLHQYFYIWTVVAFVSALLSVSLCLLWIKLNLSQKMINSTTRGQKVMHIIIYKMFKSNHIGFWHPAIITFWPEGNFLFFFNHYLWSFCSNVGDVNSFSLTVSGNVTIGLCTCLSTCSGVVASSSHSCSSRVPGLLSFTAR